MAIKVNLDKILLEKKVSLTELSQNVNVTVKNLSLLKLGKVRAVRFTTLDAICKYLNCQPGEILEFIEEYA